MARRKSVPVGNRAKGRRTEPDLLDALLATVGRPRSGDVDIPILTTRTKEDDEFAARSARYPRRERGRRR
jgi:hypothetical protein